MKRTTYTIELKDEAGIENPIVCNLFDIPGMGKNQPNLMHGQLEHYVDSLETIVGFFGVKIILTGPMKQLRLIEALMMKDRELKIFFANPNKLSEKAMLFCHCRYDLDMDNQQIADKYSLTKAAVQAHFSKAFSLYEIPVKMSKDIKSIKMCKYWLNDFPAYIDPAMIYSVQKAIDTLPS